MRISMKIAVVLVFLNSAAELMRSSGVAEAMGADPEPGAAAEMQAALDAARSIEPGGGPGDTLFQLFVAVANSLEAVFEFVLAGPSMLINIGIPEPLVLFLFAPAALIVGRDTVYLLTGRSF
jgi:hypothetical protein